MSLPLLDRRRYVLEYSDKLNFIWPHLSTLERQQYVPWDPAGRTPLEMPLLSGLAAALLLGLSTVAGWVWQVAAQLMQPF